MTTAIDQKKSPGDVESTGRPNSSKTIVSDDGILSTCLQYTREGFALFPVKGKKPFKGSHGLKDASTDPATVKRMVDQHPGCGVAIACGASGLLVVDLDVPHGKTSWQALCRQHKPIGDTLTIATPRGGKHLYFDASNEADLKPSQSELGAGIDIRADGSYVVAPPSPGYTVVNGDKITRDRIAKAPKWLIKLCRKPVQREQKPFSVGSADSAISAYSAISALSVRLTVDDVIDRTLPTRAGERNRAIFNLARGLRFDAHLTDASPQELRAIVRRWFDKARPVVTTQSFDETWFDFTHAWSRVRHPLAADLAALAFDRARVATALPLAAGDYDDTDLRLLVGACWELQNIVGQSADGTPRRWSLSCSQVARHLWKNTDPFARTKAHRWLSGLVADRVIQVAQVGKPGPAGSPATRYLFVAGGAL